MVTRVILIGVLLIACGKSESAKQGGPASAPAAVEPPASAIAGSAAPAAPATAAQAPAEPPAAPATASGSGAGSDASKDKPVAASSQAEVNALEKAIAPYREQARKSYPDAKRRFVAGLPTGHKFAVAAQLHGAGKSETVFVMVKEIKGDQITGRIDSDVRVVTGYKAGDSYTLPEKDLIDWVILRPDGSEEGNVVGKFLDTWHPPQHP